MYRPILLMAILLFATSSQAQRGRGVQIRPEGTELTVRVTFEDGRNAEASLRVQLLNGIGIPMTERFTDSLGEARFQGLRSGNYKLKVSGIGIVEQQTETFTIQDMEAMSMQYVTVKKAEDPNAAKGAVTPGAPQISARALNVPPKAAKELEKGKEALRKDKHDEAMKRFTKAAEMYPYYAEAYDHMGITAAKSSPGAEKGYFEKALEADDQYFPAYAHLAKVHITQKNYPEAERLLNRATKIDPRSPEALFLLSYAQLAQNRPDEAIKTAERTHQLEHEQYVLVHFVAGEAYARKGMRQQAIEQYSQYLKEAPLGPSADKAKGAIQMLEAQAKQ